MESDPTTSGRARSTSVWVTAFIHAVTGGGISYSAVKCPRSRSSVYLFIPISRRNSGMGYVLLVPPSIIVCWRWRLFRSRSSRSISDGVVTSRHVCVGFGITPVICIDLVFLSVLTRIASGGSTLSVWWVLKVWAVPSVVGG